MEGLLSFLFIVIVTFYFFQLIGKLIIRRKLKKLHRAMTQDDFENETTKNSDNRRPHIDPNIGEYTDYEEIE